jgi:hypothetical protein
MAHVQVLVNSSLRGTQHSARRYFFPLWPWMVVQAALPYLGLGPMHEMKMMQEGEIKERECVCG